MPTSITIFGDVCLAGSRFHDRCVSGQQDWTPFSAFAFDDTYLIANLESPISERGCPLPLKYAVLRAHPKLAHGLRELDLAVMANNHISDYGDLAISDTFQLLQEQGVDTVGYGQNLGESWQPHRTIVNNVSVLVFAACCPTTNGENLATHISPGVAPLSIQSLKQMLQEFGEADSLRIVYLHWGLENEHRVVPEQTAIARAAIDWGADVVVGCHGHVIQPYERYRDGWIFYGLGNFLFDDVVVRVGDDAGGLKDTVLNQRPENRESLAVRFEVSRDGNQPALILQEIIPVSSHDCLAPRPVSNDDLTTPPEQLSSMIPDVQPLAFYSLQDSLEPMYATHFRNGILTYDYYTERPQRPSPDRQPWLRRILQYLRRIC